MGMSFHKIEVIMQKENLNPKEMKEKSWINALNGLIKGMEPLCTEHINGGLWKDDGPDAKEVFESCPLGSEAASIAAQALEILETMEQRGVMPDGFEGNQWIPSVKIQVDEEARKLGKEQMQVEKWFEAII